MKVTNVETLKVVTVQLTQRELAVLRAALNVAEVTSDTRQEAQRGGVVDLHDDDFTALYGQICQVLR